MKENKHKSFSIFLCLVLVFLFVFNQPSIVKAAEEIIAQKLSNGIITITAEQLGDFSWLGQDSSVSEELKNNSKVITGTDYEAINTELASYVSQGFKVKFKRQTYEITGTIIIPDKAEIDFNNSTIKRKATYKGFDLIKSTGTSNLKLSNLTIDGNRAADNLKNAAIGDRFSGLRLNTVKDSELKDINVLNVCSGEIQSDQNTAGIIFENSKDIRCYELNGSFNDSTAILIIDSRVKIDGSFTHDNGGSGISSSNCHESEFNNITTHDNGFSNLSVNGIKCRVSNVLSYNSGINNTNGTRFSGVNLGHVGYPASDAVLSNIVTYNNSLDGLTITDSDNVQVNNIQSYGNYKANIEIRDGSMNSMLNNVISRDSSNGNGILYDSGSGHVINNAKSYGNFASGIYANNTNIEIGDLVETYNNGKGVPTAAGVVLVNITNSEIGDIKSYDDQTTKTQNYGIWLSGGSGNVIKNPSLSGNETTGLFESGSPSFSYSQKLYDLAGTKLNGWIGTAGSGYYKDSDGFVHLVGCFSSGTVATAAFNLPEGFRPASTQNFTTVANNAFAIGTITTTGDVILYTSNNKHYINNIVFKAK